MSMTTRRLLVLLTLPLLLLSACASIRPGEGFSEVEGIVRERSGKEIRWNQGTDADAEAQARVDSLLEGELTADAAVQIALLNNRELQAVYEELGIAQADLVQAGLLRNPIFGAEIRFQEGGGPVEFDLGISESFLSILFLPLRKRMAEAAFEATKLRVAGAVLDLAGNVRAAFYEVQGAEQLLEMRRTVAAATEASSDLAKRLNEAGNIRDLDLAAERALHEQAMVDVSAAELEVVEARERLTALMGLWGSKTRWSSGKRLPDLPTEALELTRLEPRAIERSLELGVTRQQIERLARRLGLTRTSAIVGDASVGVGAERDGDGEWSLGPTFEIPIPIFDQGQPALARAASELRMLQESYAAEAVHIRSEVRASASRSLALAARAQHYLAVLIPLRQELVRHTQEQYNAMQLGAFQLLQAKQQEIEAGSQYIEALRGYWIARAELDQLLSGRRARFEQPELRSVHQVPEDGMERRTNGLAGEER
jgi:cobalt-zinc-cadmium efflux system outer membrane protein